MDWLVPGLIVQCSVRRNATVQLVDGLYNFVKNVCRERIAAELGWLNWELS